MTEVETCPSHEIAESRLTVYSFLRTALNKPSPAQHFWMQQPAFQQALELLCDRFGVACPEEEAVPSEYAEFESRYIACFEVGLPTPPIALQASSYTHREPV